MRVFRPDDLAAGLRMLRDAGIQSLLCEGGGALGMRLLADGLVDRLYWVQAPVWLGEGAIPAFPGVPDAPLTEAKRWTPVERRALGVGYITGLGQAAMFTGIVTAIGRVGAVSRDGDDGLPSLSALPTRG